MPFISKVEMTPDHIAAAKAEADARARVASTRTTNQLAESGFRAALAKKQELIAKSAAGEPVTAQDIKDVEQAVRDAEEARAYAQAGAEGAGKAHQKAIEALRHHEQLFFRAKHRELHDHRAALAREADDALDAARAKVAEHVAFKSEFDRLRAEADAATSAPLWNQNLMPQQHPLMVPPSGSGLQITISRWANGSERAGSSIAHVLGAH